MSVKVTEKVRWVLECYFAVGFGLVLDFAVVFINGFHFIRIVGQVVS